MRWQLWRRRRSDDDFDDEVRAHVELETDRLVDAGVDPRDARAAALRAFGNVAGARERFHDTHHWVWWEQFARDLGYAWRGLWHSRAFVAATVLDARGRSRSGHGRLHDLQRVRAAPVRDPRSLRHLRDRLAHAGSGRPDVPLERLREHFSPDGPLRRGDCGRRTLRDVAGQHPCRRLRLRQLLRGARSAHAARARTRAARRGGDRRSTGRGVERPDLGAALRSRPCRHREGNRAQRAEGRRGRRHASRVPGPR